MVGGRGDYAAFESRISRMGGWVDAPGGEDKAEAGPAAARQASARMSATRVKTRRARGWKRVGEPRLLPRRGKVVVVDV